MYRLFLMLIGTLFLLFVPVFSDTNGVWIDANDITAGTFGADEGGGDYMFPSNLSVSQDLFVSDIEVTNNISAENIESDIVTANQFCINGSCKSDWSTIWQENSNGAYYNGKVGISSVPAYNAKLYVKSDDWGDNALRAEKQGDSRVYLGSSSYAGYFRDEDDYTNTYISRGDYSVLGYGKVRGSELCIGGDCRSQWGEDSAIAKPNVNTGEFEWVRVVDDSFSNGNGNKKSSINSISTQNKPILGIRMSGNSDDGGMCIARIGDFYATVGWNAKANELGDNGWSGTANNGNLGSYQTTEFIFENMDSGIWSGINEGLASEADTRGYLDNHYGRTFTYNKPLNFNYVDGGSAYMWYQQWYNDGGGEAYSNCEIDVLYGEWQ